MSEAHRQLRRDRQHLTPLFADRLFKMRILTIDQMEKERYDSKEGTIGKQTVFLGEDNISGSKNLSEGPSPVCLWGRRQEKRKR